MYGSLISPICATCNFISSSFMLTGPETYRNIQTRPLIHYCRGKAIFISYPKCVSAALVIQHAKYVAILSFRLVWLHHILPDYLKIDTIFGKTVTEHKMRVLISSTTFVWNFSHSKKNSMQCYFHVKHPLFFSDFNEAFIFSTEFRKIFKHQVL